MILVLAGVAALALAGADHVSTPFDLEFDQVGGSTGVPTNLLRALARVESGFSASAVSQPNANGTRDYGLMQINTHTLATFGISQTDALDPRTSIKAAVRLLLEIQRELGPHFSAFTWPAAYNAGPHAATHGIGEGYAQRVLWHWMLYDIAHSTGA